METAQPALVANLAGGAARRGWEKGRSGHLYIADDPQRRLKRCWACSGVWGRCIRVVFGGFAANELGVRIDDCAAKGRSSPASCGLERGRVVALKAGLRMPRLTAARHKPDFCVIFQREQVSGLNWSEERGRDYNWHGFQYGRGPGGMCSRSRATIRPTSFIHPAPPASPKGVVRPTAGHMVALHWTMKAIYNVDPGDVFWAASDVGWVVGHSYICYAPLLAGNTTIVFEGKPIGTPDAGTFWRVISEHKVKSFFTAPTAFRAVKREDPQGEFVKKYDLSCLKTGLPCGRARGP